MGDVLRAKGPIRNASGVVRWAVEQINEFTYRKEFGLSHEEFMQEPLDKYFTNLRIIQERSKIEHEQNMLAKIKSKRP